ncbi:MAG: V-type ATP synthase subunit I [Ruminococcaceae bacterium]|nr:V-type ATP synthase subunit I [Oscillospiraceae bacterium]
MINKMKKLTLVAARGDIDSIANELLWLSAVEIKDAQGESGLSSYDSSVQTVEYERRRDIIADAIDALAPFGSGKKKKSPPGFSRQSFEKLEDKLCESEKLAQEAARLIGENSESRSEINRIDAETANLAPWAKFDLPLAIDSTRSTSIIKGTLPINASLADISAQINEEADAVLGEAGRDNSFVCVWAVCMAQDREKVTAVLLKHGFSKVSFEKYGRVCADELERLKTEKADLLKKIEQNTKELKSLAEKRSELEVSYDYLTYRLDQLKVKSSILCTECTGILQGWLPVYAIPRLEKKLSEYECYYDLADPEEGEDVPVMLSNTPFASPFESIIAMYAYPKYGSFDPTIIMGIFYAIIFGLIMQDVGYGLLLVIGCPLMMKIMKPKESTKKMLKAFMICGFFTIFFGMMFGGYFSDLPLQIAQNWFGVKAESLPELALLFNPIENNMGFLILALGVGVLHLVTGLLIKAYMLIKEGDVFAAIFDVGSWLVLFAGIGLLLAVPSVGMWVAIAGAAMLVLTQGRGSKSIIGKFFKGLYSLYDLINYLSDLLSYSRIFALGLSGAIIGQVMNILGTLAGNSVVGIIAFILIFAIGHALNLALSLISAFVHTARLQYIEFFGKFYVDGGNPFKPSSVNTKYSEITEEAK